VDDRARRRIRLRRAAGRRRRGGPRAPARGASAGARRRIPGCRRRAAGRTRSNAPPETLRRSRPRGTGKRARRPDRGGRSTPRRSTSTRPSRATRRFGSRSRAPRQGDVLLVVDAPGEEGDDRARHKLLHEDDAAPPPVRRLSADIEAEVHLLEFRVERKGDSENARLPEEEPDEAGMERPVPVVQLGSGRDERLKQRALHLPVQHRQKTPLGRQEGARWGLDHRRTQSMAGALRKVLGRRGVVAP